MSSLPEVSLGGGSGQPTPVADEEVVEDAVDATSSPTRDLVQVGDLPDSDLKGGTLTPAERAVGAARYWFTEAAGSVREVTSRKDGVGDLKPESWNEYRARVKARAWLPEDVRGGLLEGVPVVFHFTIGPVLVGIGRTFDFLGRHMSAFMVALFLIVAAVVLWLCFN